MVLGRSRPVSYRCTFLLAAFLLPFASADEIVERAQSILVEVPVQVTLAGEPIKGLTSDNFEILDRGRKQELRGFDVLDLTLSAPGPPRPHPRRPVGREVALRPPRYRDSDPDARPRPAR